MSQVRSSADLGEVIRAERRRQGMTQAELAGLADVGVTFLSQLENGKGSAEVGKVLQVLTMLGVDVLVEPRG
ncbi:helix-turn-helix transcriptional regulator [Olsenella uli]|uniref:helix-turn-helix domain-containing protein n=1 Tax=Olsenella uli TaxID=133926 RepID=UPI00195B9D47|nr:helix-turn-helix domain-containing protein [Olsenella uli]MBM6675520.1 helix-turn-helix transcriptional regulator [Olsenella uli]